MLSRYKRIMACMAVIMALSVTGCTKFHTADVKDGYSTDFSRSPAEYSIYMSDKVATATNILYTRLTMASNVLRGSYPWETEISNTEEAVTKMQELIDTLTTTMPPQEYESDRQTLLDQFGQAKTYLEGYKGHLENKDENSISSDISLMEAAALAFGGEANATYK